MRRYPTSKGKGKPQQDSRRAEITFRIKPHIHQRQSGLKHRAYQDPETPQRPPRDQDRTASECLLSGTGQQRTTASAGALGEANLGLAQALLEEVTITPHHRIIEPLQNLHRTGEANSGRAQTEPYVHQDPGERSSDPTRD